jgi:hypothetical protein
MGFRIAKAKNKEEIYMKRVSKKFSKIALVAVVLGVLMFALTGCTAVQISASMALKEDGTGSRTITASIAKNDYQDGYGSAYYYLTKHGKDLADYLKKTYSASVSGSEDWLTISVDDSGSDWEVINLSFNFTSFEDYKTKLASLAYDKDAAASYVAPEFKDNGDGTATYIENSAALTAVFKSIQTSVMADKKMFDINSTKDGKALNDGSADLDSLVTYGVELMKPEFGTAMTIAVGSDKAKAVEAKDGVYSITGKYTAKAAAEVTDTKTDTTGTADNTANTSTDTPAATQVPKTGEDYTLAIVSVICLAGCAALFMVTRKLGSKNK